MKFYGFKDCADASIKCCGIWLHFRGILVGIAPDWYYENKSKKGPIRRFGLSVLTPGYWYDHRILISITLGSREFGWMRDRIGSKWRAIVG